MVYKRILYLVDKVPEIPYFILALALIFKNPYGSLGHYFSGAFIFLVVTLVMGVILKLTFRTSRPKQYKSRFGLFKYGFPSLHTMISVGALSFVYFINPWLTLILLPVGLFYVYARIIERYHTKIDVVGGALIGIATGIVIGYNMEYFALPADIEFIFSTLFFTIPVAASYGRVRKLI